MKTKLLFTLAFLAIGFGVSRVFLQGDDAKECSQNQQSPIIVPQSPMTEIPIFEPEITQASIVQPAVPEPQVPEPPVTQTSQPQGDSFYYLLHPDRKNRPDSPATDEAKN